MFKNVTRTSDYISHRRYLNNKILSLQHQASALVSCSFRSRSRSIFTYQYCTSVLSISNWPLINNSRFKSLSKLSNKLHSVGNKSNKGKGLEQEQDHLGRSNSNSVFKMSMSNFHHSNSNFSQSVDLEVSRMERFLVVGLGNYISPGTRHSVGMMAVDSLVCRLGSQWEKSRVCGGFLAKSSLTKEDGTIAAHLFLFKPKILMNINGKSVLKAAKHLDITADKIYLIHDELDKVVGKCGIKDGGSARGHKGVISCYDCLRPSPMWPKSDNGDFKGMTRLQIGIGRPASQSEVVSYVLSRFPHEESENVKMAINNGLDLLLKHITSRIVT